ncbi:Not1-domain-containing protein [Suillus brevipes Sb2]|nr:Not1-domain-containing protein [Suillus brevipes Sb2]
MNIRTLDGQLDKLKALGVPDIKAMSRRGPWRARPVILTIRLVAATLSPTHLSLHGLNPSTYWFSRPNSFSAHIFHCDSATQRYCQDFASGSTASEKKTLKLRTDPRPSLQDFAAGVMSMAINSHRLTMLIRIRSELIQLSHIDECARVNRLLEDLRHVRKATTEDIVVPALGHTTNRTAQGKVVQPFFKLFLHVFAEHLGSPYFSLLIAISDTFSSVQPTYFPGFAFSWLCLVSYQFFMPKLLLSENNEHLSAFHKHFLSLFKFLAPFLKEADPQLASRDLYRDSLRLILVLLHDFPDFLSEYYFSPCDCHSSALHPASQHHPQRVLCVYHPSSPASNQHHF